MSGLLDWFLPAVVGVVLLFLALSLRLTRRMSRNPGSAGDLDRSRPEPVGQTRTPWEVKAIDQQLRLAGYRSSTIPHYDLTATVNRLIDAAGLPANQQLPLNADRNAIDRAVRLIELRLDLVPTGGGRFPGSAGPLNAADPLGSAGPLGAERRVG